MGCFFSPNAFDNAPGHAFKNGARRVRGREIPIFVVFRGFGWAAVSAAGLSNMQRSPGAPCWKWGIFQHKIRTMTLPPTPSVETSLGFTLVRRLRTCPELRGEWVFRVGGPKKSMKRPKTRDLKKWPNIFVLARPSSFCAFFWRAWLSPKTGFWNSSNFRWNHCKRSAKWSGLENPFLHGRVWNRPSYKCQQHRPDIFLLRLALPVPLTLKWTRSLVLLVLPFPFFELLVQSQRSRRRKRRERKEGREGEEKKRREGRHRRRKKKARRKKEK